MIQFAVKFKHPFNKTTEYREYPKMAQFKNRKSLNEFLRHRTFLTDFVVSDIVEFDSNKVKSGAIELFGKLIYS